MLDKGFSTTVGGMLVGWRLLDKDRRGELVVESGGSVRVEAVERLNVDSTTAAELLNSSGNKLVVDTEPIEKAAVGEVVAFDDLEVVGQVVKCGEEDSPAAVRPEVEAVESVLVAADVTFGPVANINRAPVGLAVVARADLGM
jgi:hypothetical protein